MWSARNLLNSLLWEAAHDDMGIYPAAVIKGDVREERTPWQDGWNAAVIEMTQKYNKLHGWAEALTDTQRDMLVEMLDADVEAVKLHVRDGTVEIWIWCNDTFMYACSDSETVPLDALPDVYRLWKAHGWDGLIAWIAAKRKAEPVKEVRYDAGYVKARAAL